MSNQIDKALRDKRVPREADLSGTEIYLTAREAAAYLRSSPSTLAKRRLNGNGPGFVRIGRSVRYRRVDLDAWMEATLSTR